MSFVKRYSSVRQAETVFTGNTLCLSPLADVTGNIAGSGAVFTSLDTSLQVGGFPVGTTLDYRSNSSSAQLNLPSGAEIAYAELVWGGLYRSASSDISALTDDAVNFTTPRGTFAVQGDPVTRNNLLLPADQVTVGFYTRSAIVTDLVKNGGSGTYSIGAVPALLARPSSLAADTNHAGWTLCVIYESPSLPLRSVNLWCGAVAVSLGTGSTELIITGFLTPSSSPKGKLCVSAQEGDAVLGGDRLLFGADRFSLQNLSGPNNPATNFFASQINDSEGFSDTSGSNGTRNALPFAERNTSACRQGWDITATDVSDKLSPGQTSALIRLTTDGDLYVVNALALGIDSEGANLKVEKSAEKSYDLVGEESAYTVNISNGGTSGAFDCVLEDPLPAGLSLVNGSVAVNGSPAAGGFPLSLPDIPSQGSVTVTCRAKINALPATNPVPNTAVTEYGFSPFPGITVAAEARSNEVFLEVIAPVLTVSKAVDKTFAQAEETLTYTFTILNGGNIALSDVTFTDEIPEGTTFENGSVTVKSVPRPEAYPPDGINIGTLFPGDTAELSFKALINREGEGTLKIVNVATVDYLYTLPDSSQRTGEAVSNEVITENLSELVSRIKSTDKVFLTEGQHATQTVVIANAGSSTLKEVFLTDFMNEGGDYVEGGITVNGVPFVGDMRQGIVLPDIPSSESVTVTYIIKALATLPKILNDALARFTVTDPVRGEVGYAARTNLIAIPVGSEEVTVTKRADKDRVKRGGKIKYTSVVANTGTVTQEGLVFIDPVAKGATFVNGSVTIDGTSYPSYDPTSGFPLPVLAPGESVTVIFTVEAE